jgi:L-alanine-DL-glutamate epimerase-like enolase superfamily enzyme
MTEWLRAAAVAAARGLQISGHCAPSLHAPVAAAAANLAHVEYFADHVRVDHLLFEGVPEPDGGAFHFHDARPGLGISIKEADAARYAQ